jgi:UDP-N-acetylmuramyl pentapeptide phosphotransferase/UDP-N-acetylglucosamine-1-phosphate transferase
MDLLPRQFTNSLAVGSILGDFTKSLGADLLLGDFTKSVAVDLFLVDFAKSVFKFVASLPSNNLTARLDGLSGGVLFICVLCCDWILATKGEAI